MSPALADCRPLGGLTTKIADCMPAPDAGSAAAGGAKPKSAWELDLSKLVLMEALGTGAYGTVYKGSYDGADVAVKVMDFGEAETLARAKFVELRSSFRQEASVWSALSHPNITKFLGASISEEKGMMVPSVTRQPLGMAGLGGKEGFRIGGHVCCVVAEFVPGGTLKQFLYRHRNKKLPLKTVVQLALDLARGMEYLHSKKVVHRDIKTENLLMTKHQRLKLADFGVARVEAANPKDMTGSTGTLGYMAPEVLNGKPYDRKADVYSFGVCLWEIYCCDMPFPNLSLRDMAAVVNSGLRPTIPKVCPKELAKLMSACWDASPAARPEMAEVVRQLEAVDVRRGKGMTPLEDFPSNGGCTCFPQLRGMWG